MHRHVDFFNKMIAIINTVSCQWSQRSQFKLSKRSNSLSLSHSLCVCMCVCAINKIFCLPKLCILHRMSAKLIFIHYYSSVYHVDLMQQEKCGKVYHPVINGD